MNDPDDSHRRTPNRIGYKRKATNRQAGVLKRRFPVLKSSAKAYGKAGTPRKRKLTPYKKKPPAFWVSIAPLLAGQRSVPEYRVNLWLLVLEARRIPHFFQPSRSIPILFVPAMYELIALHEIQTVESERQIPIFVQPKRDNLPGVALVLMLLVLWHGIRWGWHSFSMPVPPFPESAKAWAVAFGVDPWRIFNVHEWWRAVTALTLHADDEHLLSNIAFGLLFLVLLCRRAGLGLGMMLTLLAGALGNVCNALFKDAHVISIGFSTALFGAVGAICVLNVADIVRHHYRFAHMNAARQEGMAFALVRRLAVPLAAGLALLGILGGGGEARTDYGAHIWGFVCGVLVTLATLPLEKRIFAVLENVQKTIQAVLFGVTLAGVFAAWLFAIA